MNGGRGDPQAFLSASIDSLGKASGNSCLGESSAKVSVSEHASCICLSVSCLYEQQICLVPRCRGCAFDQSIRLLECGTYGRFRYFSQCASQNLFGDLTRFFRKCSCSDRIPRREFLPGVRDHHTASAQFSAHMVPAGVSGRDFVRPRKRRVCVSNASRREMGGIRCGVKRFEHRFSILHRPFKESGFCGRMGCFISALSHLKKLLCSFRSALHRIPPVGVGHRASAAHHRLSGGFQYSASLSELARRYRALPELTGLSLGGGGESHRGVMAALGLRLARLIQQQSHLRRLIGRRALCNCILHQSLSITQRGIYLGGMTWRGPEDLVCPKNQESCLVSICRSARGFTPAPKGFCLVQQRFRS